MAYETKLFGTIPYTVRESDKPIYNQQTIEKYLVEHYGSKEEAIHDILEVFHDDKHCGNMMNVETKSENGTFWYPKCEGDTDEELENFMNSSDTVGLVFQIAYDYKITIVESICKKFGMKNEDLDSFNNRVKVAEKLINLFATNDLAARFAETFADELGKIKTEKDVRDWLENKIMSQNIVKSTCKELGITQKELAEMLDVQPSAISNWANGQIPKMAQLALELLIENKMLKNDLNIIKKAHEILHR